MTVDEQLASIRAELDELKSTVMAAFTLKEMRKLEVRTPGDEAEELRAYLKRLHPDSKKYKRTTARLSELDRTTMADCM